MKINDKDFKTYFHADVCSFNDITMEIVNETFLPYGSYLPLIQSTRLQPQVKELVLDFTSVEDMSNFAAEIVKPCVIDVEDDYFYDCVLNGKQETQDGVHAYSASYTFEVMKRKELKSESASSFQVEGNCVCGCIYEIHAKCAVDQVCVNDMTLYHMDENTTIVIDGIHKVIYDTRTPDISAFDQSDLTSFPKLSPGIHQVAKNSEQVDVTIKYYPVFM